MKNIELEKHANSIRKSIVTEVFMHKADTQEEVWAQQISLRAYISRNWISMKII